MDGGGNASESSGFFVYAGDDTELVEKFVRLARIKSGLKAVQHASQPDVTAAVAVADKVGVGSEPSSSAASPVFAVYLGTTAEDAVAMESRYGAVCCNGFVMAGVAANEQDSGSPPLDSSEAASFAFVFRGNPARSRLPLRDYLANLGDGQSLGAFISVLQSEQEARVGAAGSGAVDGGDDDGDGQHNANLFDSKSLAAASALAACRDGGTGGGLKDQWQIVAFSQDQQLREPAPISDAARTHSVVVVGCGVVGQEVARELARHCPASLARVTFLDPSLVTEWDSLAYFRGGDEELGQRGRAKSDVAAETFSSCLAKKTTAGPGRRGAPETRAVRAGVGELADNSADVKSILGDSDVWINCVSSTVASRFVAQASLDFVKPVVDVAVYPGDDGVSGCGQVCVYHPRVTESMNCLNEVSPDDQPPLCVVATFPFEPRHAVAWAIEKIGKTRKKVAKETRILTLEECVARARRLFEKWFNFRIRRLLRTFPLDMVSSDTGKPYWSFPKVAPAALDFRASDPAHLTFVRTVSRFVAECNRDARSTGDEVVKELGSLTDGHFRDMLAHVPVPDFDGEYGDARVERKPISDDQSRTFDAAASAAQLSAATGKLCKDDESSLALVALVARLRCDNYGIRADDAAALRLLCWETCAGHKLCDVAACSVAASFAVSALQAVLNRLDWEQQREAEVGTQPVDDEPERRFANVAFATNPMYLNLWTPQKPKVLIKTESKVYTVWDRVHVKGDKNMTFRQLCARVQRIFRQEPPTMVLQDKSILYMFGMTREATLKKRAQDVIKHRGSEFFVDLLFGFDGDGEEVVAPAVRYEWDFA